MLTSAGLPFTMLTSTGLTSTMLTFAMLTFAGLTYAMLTYAMLTFAGLTFAGLSFAMLTFAGLTYAGLSFAMLTFAGLTSTTHHFPYGAEHLAFYVTPGWCRNCYTTCAASMFGTARSGINCGTIPGWWRWRIKAM